MYVTEQYIYRERVCVCVLGGRVGGEKREKGRAREREKESERKTERGR